MTDQIIIINQETDAAGIIDMQNDFGEAKNAKLGVPGAFKTIAPVNRMIMLFRNVFASKDNHPDDHGSFADQHGVAPFTQIVLNGLSQTAWPGHCKQGSWGAKFFKELLDHKFFAVIYKGMNKLIDSYSAFYENDRVTSTGLAGLLRERGIKRIFLGGLAKYHCVAYTALDAIREGFDVYIVEDATAAIPDAFCGPEEQEAFARKRLIDAGVKFCTVDQLVAA